MNKVTQLINTLGVQSASYESERMEKYIRKQLKRLSIEYKTDSYGNIYACKTNPKTVSQSYPTIVCHIDTVHDVNLNSIVRRHGDVLYSIDATNYKRTGIGGDDKVGVFIALQCLETLPHVKAVFFKDEEVGCVGSSKADFSFFDNSTIVLECDRRGMGDFVKQISGVQLCNDDLLDTISNVLKMYDRKPVTGGMTDVLQIANNHSVQVANINCGYYQPHTDDEFVVISDVLDTLSFVLDVFETVGDQELRMTRTSYRSKYYSYSPYNYDWGYNKSSGYRTVYDSSDETYTATKDVEPKHITVPDTCPCGGGPTSLAYDEFYEDFFCYDCNKYITEPAV